MKRITAQDIETTRRAYVAAIDTRDNALIAVARAHFERVIGAAKEQS